MSSFGNYTNFDDFFKNMRDFRLMEDAINKRGTSMAEEIIEQLRKQRGIYYDIYKVNGKGKEMIEGILSTYQKYSSILNDIDKKNEKIAKKNKLEKETVDELRKAYKELLKAEERANKSEDPNAKRNLEAVTKKYDKLKNQTENTKNAANDIESDIGNIKKEIKLEDDLSKKTQKTADATQKYRTELDIANEKLKKSYWGWGLVLNAIDSTIDAVKEVGNYWMQVQDRSFKVARQMGLSREQAAAMTKAQLQMTKELAFEYGVTQEQLMKFQETYTQETGKAVQLTKGEIESMTVMSKLGDDNQAAQWASEMSKYGKGIEETAGEFVLIQDKAKALCLNASKATETIAKNLHLANSYTFIDGTNGITKMALKAQSLRVDMEQMMGAVDKFQDIQSAIETSANLQMLGGGFAAQFSNPMAALYGGLNDPNQIMDSVIKAVQPEAKYNEKTGEAEISGLGMAKLRAASQQLGVSVEQLSQLAKSQAVNAEVDKAMGANAANMDDQHKSQIENLAHRNAQGQWVITNYADNGQENGEISVDKITPKDLDRISQVQPEEKDMFKDVHNIDANVAALAGGKSRAQLSVSAKEQLEGLKEGTKASGANQLNGAFSWIANSANNGFLNWLGKGIVEGGIFSLFAGKIIKSSLASIGLGSAHQASRSFVEKVAKRKAGAASFGTKESVKSNGNVAGSSPKETKFEWDSKANKGKGAWRANGRFASEESVRNARYERRFGGRGFGSKAKGAFGRMKDVSKNFYNSTKNATKNVFNSAKDFTRNIFSSTKNVANGAENIAQNTASATGKKTASKLAESFGKVGGKFMKGAGGKILKGVGKKLPGIGTLMTAGFAISDLMSASSDFDKKKSEIMNSNLSAEEKEKQISFAESDKKNKQGRAVGSAVGATVGGILGNAIPIPVIGSMIGMAAGEMIGGAIGSLYGGNARKDAANKFKGAEMGETTLEDPELMQKAALATISIHDILATKFQKENGLNADGTKKSFLQRTGDLFGSITDLPILKQAKNLLGFYSNGGIVPERAATGRIVGGDSYTGDKVPVMANSGEMILNKSEQNQMFKALSVGSPTISPISSKPYTGKETIRTNNTPSSSYAPQVGPTNISLNVSGTIRLDLGGRQASIDPRKLLDNSQFRSELTNIISRQLNTMGNGGKYNKEGSTINTMRMYNKTR